MSKICEARGYHAAVLYKKHMLILGGVGYARKDSQLGENSSSRTANNDREMAADLPLGFPKEKCYFHCSQIHLYDFQSHAWTLRQVNGNGPEFIENFPVVLIQDQLYVHGGWDGVSCCHSARMFVLNLITERWAEVTPVGKRLSARAGHCMWGSEVLNNISKLWIFGGQGKLPGENDLGLDDTVSSEKYERDVYNNQLCCGELSSESENISWRVLHPTGCGPSGRAYHATTCLNGNLYVHGGRNRESRCLQDFYVLMSYEMDPCWKKLEPLPTICSSRYRATLVSIAPASLLIIGGWTENGEIAEEAWSYNTESSSWALFCTPVKRAGHSCIVYANSAWIFGGEISTATSKAGRVLANSCAELPV